MNHKAGLSPRYPYFFSNAMLIEADSLEDAVRIAHEFPWIRFGSIEVRPVRDFDAVRRRVVA